jgi:ADP-ribosylglycohydrolase
MLGALIGDIVGSIYEWDNHRSKDFPLFGPGCDYTDDSVCTVALADALLTGADPARHLQRWCRRHPGRGYGGMFAEWIVAAEPVAYHSYGNGAAMRVSAAGWLADAAPAVVRLSDRITAITHNHPEGLKGARATAHAIFRARQGVAAREIRDEITLLFGCDLSATVDEIRPGYEFNETCQRTVPEALVCALSATSFEDAIRNAISIGGDSDTVAAIAGSVAEPLFGIPPAIAGQARSYLPADMLGVLEEFGRVTGGGNGKGRGGRG